MNSDLYLEREKVEIARQILSINSVSLINVIKTRLADLFVDKVHQEKELECQKTERLLNMIGGKWVDDKSADEMLADIYASRKQKDNATITQLFEE